MVATFKKPGWPRAMLGALIAGAFGFGLVVGLRAISGLPIFQTEQTGYPHLIVPAITIPLGWLVGFGAFDYWFRWAAGKPTIPEDHSSHGATSWKDYFKFNTDHKVIGIQYICSTFVFFFIGGPAEPVVEGTEADEPAERHRDRGDDDVRVASLLGLENLEAADCAQANDKAEAERRADQRSEHCSGPTGCLYRCNHVLPPDHQNYSARLPAPWPPAMPVLTPPSFGMSF